MVFILQHIEKEGPGLILPFLKEEGFRAKIIKLYQGQSLPQDFETIEAVVIMGGPMSVYAEAEYPFLPAETRFLAEIIKKQVPALGVCLGAQLLAKAAGAKVRLSACREAGYLPVELTPEGKKDLLFSGFPETIEVFQWHTDVFELPKESLLLAKSSFCPHQAAKIGRNAYALQFHVEVDAALASFWCQDDLAAKERFLQEAEAQSILKNAPAQEEAFKQNARLLVKNFANIIKSRFLPFYK